MTPKDKANSERRLGEEVLFLFNLSYCFGFLVFCMGLAAAASTKSGSFSWGLFYFILFVGLPIALVAYIPSAFAYFAVFFPIFFLLRKVLHVFFAAGIAAAISGYVGMTFAMFVNIDLWPLRVSLEANAIPDWPAFQWIAAISSGFFAFLLRPGYELYVHE